MLETSVRFTVAAHLLAGCCGLENVFASLGRTYTADCCVGDFPKTTKSIAADCSQNASWRHEMEWRRDTFVFTNEPTSTSVDETFRLLQATYWGHKRPLELVQRVIRNSLCFYLREAEKQIGFARVITDYATTSWLSDVVLEPNHQNSGLGSWMMACVFEHPEICDTQFALQTGTAHEFYERLGFTRSDSLMSTPVDYL